MTLINAGIESGVRLGASSSPCLFCEVSRDSRYFFFFVKVLMKCVVDLELLAVSRLYWEIETLSV
jgi:hypothetical protein